MPAAGRAGAGAATGGHRAAARRVPAGGGVSTSTAAGGGARARARDAGALWRLAVATLDGNWEHDHTVPSRTLYPHQWSWDSAFVAVGLAHVRPDRAWRELRTLFAAQWADGRVPHIVFNPALRAGSYFPGPDFWDSARAAGAPAVATSGIVQPPVHALAAWLVHRRAPSERSRAELAWLYPRLVAWQRYLTGRRDVGGAGLACLVHPWESGLDNSPAWDAPLAAVAADAAVMKAYRRHDTAHADAAHRPTDLDYARYVALGRRLPRPPGYRDDGLGGRHPFLVECPLVNTALGLAEHGARPRSPARSAPTRGRTASGRPGSPRPWWTGCTTRSAAPSTPGTCVPAGSSRPAPRSASCRWRCPAYRPGRSRRCSPRRARPGSGWPPGWIGRCPATTAPRRTSSRCATGGARAGRTSTGCCGGGCAPTTGSIWRPGCVTR
ncbi:conserved hypothetical protein [Micromonospora sp. ATCC 39149]|nr:conserved hypothetical protein [Micromonospora sp. ATCC 39149]